MNSENGLCGYKWCPKLNLSIQLETNAIIKFKLNI